MASLLCRGLGQVARRTALISSARTCFEAPPVDPLKGKSASKDRSMPDGLGHTVGPERWELLTRSKGNTDPYEMNISEIKESSRDNPNLVPCTIETRIVGCICEEDSLTVNWMYLHQGESKRCECGHWFKLVPVDTSKYYTE
ncbi:hypothetical protein CAPTEDRAFT_20548 [Capitella teleta]|uniref:Cytochrome c oxidase subunit 5B, mitochondrial n=1 Tax=Capitella teleta TaxID=283909 RepID=R7TZP2_CAPTE|nr:hypothetical protein CAPTEDRAFT_20548 [Capitella teleta]|eukprot:ELT99102.1 hypothetical protein CAPTEDRAFT_20548 [Capitella teleta]